MKLDFKFNLVWAAAVALTTAGHALAAAPPRVLRGSVSDTSGAAVVGATVKIAAGDTERTVVTDTSGRFSVERAGGSARIEVTSPGFALFSTEVQDAKKTVDVVLVPATRGEKVTVLGSRVTADRVRSATRTDTPLRDVPQAVSVITRAFMDDQRMRGVPDLLRYVPGVGVAQGEGNRDAAVFRGNSSTSDFFEDGVRDDVQYVRDLYNAERVEVLKGPNAMIFGRGGVGGVLNRVPRRADGSEAREVTVQAGAWNERRVTGDLGRTMGRLDTRLTAVYENSDSYREGVGLERYGFNPTFAFALDRRTTLRGGYERFHDRRTADRGVPSFAGRPLDAGPGQFFGNADQSFADITVDALSASVEHERERFTVRNHLRYAAYDKMYQNVFPGAVNAGGTQVAITAYNDTTERRNVFNQTDVVVEARTGPVTHTLLAGGEIGRQTNENQRNTGFFTSLGRDVTTAMLAVGAPTTSLPVEFRQRAADPHSDAIATVGAVYVQDQVHLTRWLQAIAGVRYDRFAIDFTNRRSGQRIETTDATVSPRLGVIVKPRPSLSLYASRTRSFLPRAGEQLNSLTPTTRALDPEEYGNDEAGVKWERDGVSFAAAVYRLDRGNIAVPDPVEPTVMHLVEGQRSQGVELELAGNPTAAWTIIAGYAYQDGEITQSLSSAALAGARLPHSPEHSFAVWNRYDLSSAWGIGLGVIHRGAIFASTDNAVTLPGFTRVDAGLFATFGRLRGQLNVENLLDERYYAHAHNNNNITPGSPRAARVALTARF